MSSHPAHAARTPSTTASTSDTSEWVRRLLLACGPLSGLIYIGWHEIAALQWEGYSRISNAVSELHLSGAPSKWVLDPWQGVVFNAAMIAFGIGVWRSAGDKRTIRAAGALLTLSGATYPLWLVFGENLTAHIIASAVSVLSWLGALAFGAVALGRRFGIYTLATIAVFVGFFGLAFAYAPEVDAGEPTPWIGLYERIAFTVFFLWLSVLAVVLWRRSPRGTRPPVVADQPPTQIERSG